MTKIRKPLSIEHILAGVIKDLDENNVKELTGKSLSHYRKCSDPDDKDHNLHFNDADLGNFNTLNLAGDSEEKPKYLYHLITDTGYFHIENYKIKDYNSALENILDIHEKIQSLF